MISKAKSITHVGAAIDYVIKREKAELLVKEKVIGNTGAEIADDFRIFQRQNYTCRNNALSVVISPAIEDGKRLDSRGLRAITRSYLDKMGLAGHQYAAFVHHDKAHKHIHLFVNRIDSQGNAAEDHFISKRSQRITDEIAQERGLVRAKEVQQAKQASLRPLKAQMKQIHLEAMKSYPVSFDAYSRAMQSRGVVVEPTINREGHRQGFRVARDGVSLKASEVWKGMTLKNIEPLFERAKQHEQSQGRGFGWGGGMER
jgi:hypothetical protein